MQIMRVTLRRGTCSMCLIVGCAAAEETDLSMVHWAQYMDIFNTSDQIGLVDWWGNPRPAWWAFHWYAELPPERVVCPSSHFTCSGNSIVDRCTCIACLPWKPCLNSIHGQKLWETAMLGPGVCRTQRSKAQDQYAGIMEIGDLKPRHSFDFPGSEPPFEDLPCT